MIIIVYDYFLLQVALENNNNIGKISSLPANISNINTSFDKLENSKKFPVGPTFESPGPILLNVATTEVKQVSKSKLSSVTIKSETAIIIR